MAEGIARLTSVAKAAEELLCPSGRTNRKVENRKGDRRLPLMRSNHLPLFRPPSAFYFAVQIPRRHPMLTIFNGASGLAAGQLRKQVAAPLVDVVYGLPP
jgi:hypothetical protein